MFSVFVKKTFLFSFLASIFLVALNFFIDPFDVHSFQTIKGINHQKYETKGRLTVALKIINKRPKEIVLGTSRVTMLNMENLDNENHDSFYNAGMLGASFDETYAYFLHALYLQPELKQVILGIDLFSFNENRKVQSDFEEDRLCCEDWKLKDWKNLLFSYKAVSASLYSLYMSLLEKMPSSEILKMGEKTYLQSMLRTAENYKDYKIDREKIKKFETLVEICKQNSIKLTVFICPVKAMYWEFYHQNGLWTDLESLKKELCSIYPLWDFTGFNPFTLETLETGGKAIYYECSHMTEYGGSLIMKRMFGQPSLIDSIGFLLTPENVDQVMAEQHFYMKSDQISTAKR